MQTSERTKLGESFMDQGRFVPAKEVFQQVRSQTKVPWYRLLAAYNTGAVIWDKLGDGVAAREAYLDAASLEGPDYDEPHMRMMRANALENLMLLAISYDEFYAFAERLRAVAPKASVLTGLSPTVEEIRENGEPWTHVMFHLATVNYNRNDPALDRGRYGVARSTYHLVLANRKSFRLSRESWRLCIYEFGALSMRMTADCMKTRGEPDPNPTDEYMGILTDALPYFDEYLVAMSGDQSIRELRDRIVTGIHRAEQRDMEDITRPETPAVPAGTSADTGLRCEQCHHLQENPLEPCASCGAPSPIGFWVTLFSLSVGLGGGALTSQYLAGCATWVRIVGSAAGGLFLMMLAGPVIMQLCMRWFLKRRD